MLTTRSQNTVKTGKVKLDEIDNDRDFRYQFEGNLLDRRYHGYGSETINHNYYADGLNVKSYYHSYNGEYLFGKRHGYGKLYTNNYTYDGKFFNGKFHGEGIYTDKKSSKSFTGNFVDGRLTKACIKNMFGVVIYQGGVKNYKKHGYGTETLKRIFYNNTYSGNFAADKKIGRCVIDNNMFSYTGSVYNGEFHGKGHLKNLNEDYIYEGVFRFGAFHGHGELLYGSESRFPFKSFTGNFSNGEFSGFGKLSYKNEVYEGHFLKGKFHGRGEQHITKLVEIDNISMDYTDYYIGDFSNGKRHGNGKLKFHLSTTNQTIVCHYDGQFEFDKFISGTCDTSGFGYYGEFEYHDRNANNNYDYRLEIPLFHGDGGLTFKSTGNSYKGQFRYGEFHGLGCATIMRNGSFFASYTGSFSSNKAHGKIYIIYANNDSSTMTAIDGHFVNCNMVINYDSLSEEPRIITTHNGEWHHGIFYRTNSNSSAHVNQDGSIIDQPSNITHTITPVAYQEQSTAEQSSTTFPKCITCVTENVNRVSLCGHLTTCADCVEHMINKESGMFVCPICRTEISPLVLIKLFE